MEYSVIDYLFSPDSKIQEKIKYSEIYEENQRRASRICEKLEKTLNEEQKEMLNKLLDCYYDAECEASEIFFRQGVKIGARFVSECMFD